MDRKYSTGGSELVGVFMNNTIPDFHEKRSNLSNDLIWATEDHQHLHF